MRAMVTGAGGLLGRAVAATLEGRGAEVFALTRAELDITDGPATDRAVRGLRPEVVVNCAGWTEVDAAEEHETDAARVNDEGAALLAAAADSIGAKYIYPSSDYVFDGRQRRPYVESDPTSAISAYGRSKLGGETSVAVANPRHFIVRTSWLFGPGGKNFVETMLQLAAEQSEVVVVSDQVGCPTYTGHLAEAIADLVEGEEFGTHHIAGAGRCSWYEFAQEIFDQSGLECRVMAATSEMLDRAAPRPRNSVLRSERKDPIMLPPWRDGLAAYLAEREGVTTAL